MTFRLPEIVISDRLYALAKIMILVTIFLVVVIGVLSAADAYEFVYCFNEVTNTTITYPTGTQCDIEEEEDKDEKIHEEWAEANED